jgi:hypothetical protein
VAGSLPTGVLSVTPRATGYAHVVADGGVSVRLALVVPLEFVHELLGTDVAGILAQLAHDPPRRGMELTS